MNKKNAVSSPVLMESKLTDGFFSGAVFSVGWTKLPALSVAAVSAGLFFTWALVSPLVGAFLFLASLTGLAAIVIHKLMVVEEECSWEASKLSMALKTSFEKSIISFDCVIRENKAFDPRLQPSHYDTTHSIIVETTKSHSSYKEETSIKKPNGQIVFVDRDISCFNKILKCFGEYELLLEKTKNKSKEETTFVIGASKLVDSTLNQTSLPTMNNNACLFTQRKSEAIRRDRLGYDCTAEKISP